MDDYDIPYSETVDARGAKGEFLAPDECRTCWMEKSKIVANCPDHK